MHETISKNKVIKEIYMQCQNSNNQASTRANNCVIHMLKQDAKSQNTTMKTIVSLISQLQTKQNQ